MFKKGLMVTALAAVVVLALAVGPAGAGHAQGAGAIVFRGVATATGLCYPGIDAAGVRDCGGSGLPGDEDLYTWSLDLFSSLDNNKLDFCVGVESSGNAGAKHAQAGNILGTGCDIKSSGTGRGSVAVNGTPVGPTFGGWCGLSSGYSTNQTITINGHNTLDAVQWITSAATVLPIEDANLTNNVYSVGVVDAIGSISGGDCGVTNPSQGFNVVGVGVAVRV